MSEHSHETDDHQAPNYQAPEGPHDTAYQPEEQGDGGAYQPHQHHDQHREAATADHPAEEVDR